MLTAIVILDWNCLDDTCRCLRSLQELTDVKYKIIVIDNGSTINEAGIIKKKFPVKTEVYRLEKNIGFTGGSNYGIKKAQKYNPDYYLLLNNDTIVENDFLKYLIDSFISNKNVGISCPLIFRMNDHREVIYSGSRMNWILGKPYHLTDIPSNRRIVESATGAAMLIKKEVIENIGLLDERFFAYFEDTAFSVKANQFGYISIVEPKAKIYHKVTTSTNKNGPLYTYLLSRNRILFVNNYLPFYYKVYFLFFNFSKLFAVVTYFYSIGQNKRGYAFLKGYVDGIRGIGGQPRI